MYRKHNYRLISALLLVFCISTGTHLTAQELNPQHSKLDRYLTTLSQHDKAMTAVFVSKDGTTLYEHYSGLASVEKRIPLSAKTKFRIGSITKVFTSVLIMQLIEAGKLTLDTDLARFFPDLPNAKIITIKQLLSHRSGIKSFTDDPEYVTYMTTPQSRKDIEDRIISYKPLFKPNSKHQYSNSNYVLLGYIIESLYQKPYADVLSMKIVTPLNLVNTYYGNGIDIEDNEASSYRYIGTWMNQPATHMSVPHAAGAIVSNAQETNLFLSALFTGKLISENSLNAMMALIDGAGLGLFVAPFYQQKFHGHNGSIDGFQSMVGHNLSDGITLTVLSNGINYNFNDVLIAVLSSIYGRNFDIPDFSAKPVVLGAAPLNKLEGAYESKDLPLDISFWIVDEQLVAQATGQPRLPLTAYSETEFRFDQAGIVIHFEPKSIKDGKLTQFTLNQRGGKFLYTRKN